MVVVVACQDDDETPASARERTLIEQAAGLMRQARAIRDPLASARLQLDAATMTEASFRSSGRAAEGQAAVVLYRGLEGGPLGCKGQLSAAVLTGELSGDLGPVRDAARALKDSGCSEDAARILSTVGSGVAQAPPDMVSVPLAPDPSLFADGPVRVTQIERYGALDSARIVVHLSGPAHYEAGSLPPEPTRGPRFFVDIAGASYEGASSLDVGGVVERVRVGEGESTVRVVLDLRERAYQRVFYLPEPFRLVIDISSEAPKIHPRTGERRVSRVVIDPGHGGHDPGAIGSSGLQEKDVALDIAHRAAPLIARELGIDTLLTRDTDEFIPLDQRVAKANAFGADLFISLHCNASENPESRGVMTFVLDASKDALAERVAARENSSSRAASQHLATLLSQVMDAEGVARSTHFADLLQRASMASLKPSFPPLIDGGVRRAGFFVLAGAQMPAVLYEVSFISNPVEEQRLDTAGYRQKVADAVVNAVRAYRDGM